MILKCEVEITTLKDISGFDLGDMTLIGELGNCSSKSHIPNQSMMIFISITELLDGIRRFFLNNLKKYEFIATDSSFTVWFIKNKNNIVTISCKKKVISRLAPKKLAISIWKNVGNFIAKTAVFLPDDDSVVADLYASISDFDEFMNQIGWNTNDNHRIWNKSQG